MLEWNPIEEVCYEISSFCLLSNPCTDSTINTAFVSERLCHTLLKTKGKYIGSQQLQQQSIFFLQQRETFHISANKEWTFMPWYHLYSRFSQTVWLAEVALLENLDFLSIFKWLKLSSPYVAILQWHGQCATSFQIPLLLCQRSLGSGVHLHK